MNLSNLDDLLQLKKDVNELNKCVKQVDSKSSKLRDLDIGASRAQRGKALNALNEAVSHLNRLEDNIHATLVNLGLTPRLDDEHYGPREIEIANGASGFSNTFKYQPKQPRDL